MHSVGLSGLLLRPPSVINQIPKKSTLLHLGEQGEGRCRLLIPLLGTSFDRSDEKLGGAAELVRGYKRFAPPSRV